MDYFGERVLHKVFGKGVVVSQTDTQIVVKFESGEEKRFSYPSCFEKFLKLANPKAERAAERAILDDALVKEQKAKQEHDAIILASIVGEGKRQKAIPPRRLPLYTSMEAFCVAQERMLLSEMTYLRSNGGKRIRLHDGALVEVNNERYVYSFESDSELNIPDNSQITIWLKHGLESVSGILIYCEDFTVILDAEKPLSETEAIEFSAEPWRLLNFLNERLKRLQEKPSAIAEAIVCDGRKMIRPDEAMNTGQNKALQMSLEQPITFIWGPPGTGKTKTLADIALAHIAKGNRVLMLSYSNVSVDGAILRVFDKDMHKEPGKLVRYGYPKDKFLLDHEYLTAYNLILKKHPDLFRESEKLQREKSKLVRTMPRYVEVVERLTKIKRQLDDEEKRVVKEASFVATTVSKAVADKVLYNSSFDVVIFDEASMAYIPQIVFAAGLAKRHFVCLGDFAQLPPIVQSENNLLDADIFEYCGITGAVDQGCGHKWLCMLNIQYRMHPDIAEIASQAMYHGLLKSGPDMTSKRQDIVQQKPFEGNALQLADLSGMLSVCRPTSDHSCINVLSAMLSMGLAINAAKTHEVGIITPYNAQSRLLRAMSRDVAEVAPELKKIICATVHQFQGSEEDVIVYDAVDCYRLQHPGALLTNMANNSANRLFNVALTRARGKMISVVNVDFMMKKNLSKSLLFRNMIDYLIRMEEYSEGKSLLYQTKSAILCKYRSDKAEKAYLRELGNAESEIIIYIPGKVASRKAATVELPILLSEAEKRGCRVIIKTEDVLMLPYGLQKYAKRDSFITDPVTIIDKKTVWYGMPISEASFISEGVEIPTQYRVLLRFKGRRFAQSLIGFLR